MKESIIKEHYRLEKFQKYLYSEKISAHCLLSSTLIISNYDYINFDVDFSWKQQTVQALFILNNQIIFLIESRLNQHMLIQQETAPIFMLFLVEGKLTESIKLYQLNGSIQIKDVSNLALIVGNFQDGFCNTAKIFFHGNNQVQNVKVEVNRDGDVMVGGAHINSQVGMSEYNGGMVGYRKHGYGELFFDGRREYGRWENDLRQGLFIEQEACEGGSSKISKIKYCRSMAIQQIQLITNGNEWTKIHRTFMKGGRVVKLDQSMYQILLKDIEKEKITLKQDNSQILSKVDSKYRLQLGFTSVDLTNCIQLSYKMCQTYLSIHYHTQMCQQKGRTAVLSIQLADLINQQQDKSIEISREREKYIKILINRSMNQFSGIFKLLSGFWTYIIIPFALPNKYNHYSFARITVSKGSLRYIYYDSLKSLSRFSQMSLHYFQITKKLLLGQMLKDSCNQQMQSAIVNMKLQIDDTFPQQIQGDYDYCGYYMLKGIQQLMKLDRICFQSFQIKEIRKEILSKLGEIVEWSEVQEKQKGN